MKALIAMSGGVDSSVAALFMKEKGYDCIGCTMKLYSNEDAGICKGHTCCSLDDVQDARNVANRLEMPYYVLNFMDKFHEKVIDKFVDCYEHGRTPNPCIDCNRYMKFEKLYDRAKEYGCDKIVTGHYARIRETENGYVLMKAKDLTKDQSYVLYSMTQDQLAHTEFPLGEMTKADVRKIADANDFINANKPDSQDICFVPDGDYVSAIKRFTGKEYPKGNFVDSEGKVLGQHKGIIGYTIGQRKGLGIAAEAPYYVCRIDVARNEVVLGSDADLFEKKVEVEDINWITPGLVKSDMKIKVKIRYRQVEQSASVHVDGDRATVIFDEPQRAITPGQAAVFYMDEIVLGGGIIK